MRKSPSKKYYLRTSPSRSNPPGTVSAYSNYGAALAALIVEEASGQSYKDYIKEHILLPLGMTHTSVGPFWMDVDGLLDHKAKGYSYNLEKDFGGRMRCTSACILQEP